MARLRTMNRRRRRKELREWRERIDADLLGRLFPYQRAAFEWFKSKGRTWDDVLKLPVRSDPPGSLGGFIVRSASIHRILYGDGMVSGRTAHNHPNPSYDLRRYYTPEDRNPMTDTRCGLRPSDQGTIHRIGLDHIIVDEAEPLVSREILEALPCA